MSEDRYLFVDGAHLRHNFLDVLSKWGDGDPPELSVEDVKTHFNAGKCFYYDAIDDRQKPGEDDQSFRARVGAEEAFHERVQRIYGTHVRLGSVTGTLKNRRQKQ